MNEPGELDPALVAARRALLDALQALESQRAAVIVAGAQAIYMHTGEADVPLAPFTIDGDIVLDVGALLPQPTLADAMKRARFELGNQPGRWIDAQGVVIDLHVPDSLGGPGRRAARLGPHGRLVARKARGLEAAIVDRMPLVIRALDRRDRRRITADVAGPAALLIAKLYKVADRIGQAGRSNDKDAHDVYRLLRGTDTGALGAGVTRLLAHP